jgi:hypothetical protein
MLLGQTIRKGVRAEPQVGIQDEINRKGLISEPWKKKQAFFIFAEGLQGKKRRQAGMRGTGLRQHRMVH